MAEVKLVRIHAVVSGRVQGVAFRYFTRRAAVELQLSGWVMNRADGGVEVEAQGPEPLVNRFREALRQGPPLAFVANYVETPVPVVDGDKGFVIRY